MTALFWGLVLTTAVCGGGYLCLFLFANGFRGSFGASENNPLLAILPLAAAAMLLGGILFPLQRPLLHTAAIVAAVLVGFCVWTLLREGATVMWFALLYFAAWFLYYWLVAWRVNP